MTLRVLPTRIETYILFGALARRAMMVGIKLLESIMKNVTYSANLPAAPHTLLLAVLVALSSIGCTEKQPAPIKADLPLSSAPVNAPSTTVLGVEPAGPTREPAATTSKDKTDMSKEQQSTSMPLPGQANDHSVLRPASSPQRSASR